jgi:hypothetical protein
VEGKGLVILNLQVQMNYGELHLTLLDFMPLVSANYSGGIIITDWYSENINDSIKITLRFLSNEIRSDAIRYKSFLQKM